MGRKRINPKLKKKRLSIALPVRIIERLQDESNYNKLILDLILQYYKNVDNDFVLEYYDLVNNKHIL